MKTKKCGCTENLPGLKGCQHKYGVPIQRTLSNVCKTHGKEDMCTAQDAKHRVSGSEHTPTPWSVEAAGVTGVRTIIAGNNGDDRVAIIDGSGEEYDDKANAAFIVRAVNSHEELLEAAKALVKYGVVGDEYKEQVRQAIAKAEGK